MEFFIKESLDKLMLREPKLEWEKKMKICGGILKGIHFMHQQNVIHRYLKSSNVLIDGSYNPKITDFGLSKTKELHFSKSVVFDFWTAPEIFKDSPYSSITDMYAVGIIFCEVSSWVPFSGGFENKMVGILDGNRFDIPDNTPVEFKDLIFACWHTDPDQRPDSLGALKMFPEKYL